MAVFVAKRAGKPRFAVRKTYDESKHPRDDHGRWVDVPAEPGTVAIPAGHVRLYHQTREDVLEDIRANGIRMDRAQGIEGPRAIYADERGFYGKPSEVPTVEFHVPRERWDAPFVRADSVLDRGMVAPENIVAIHYPWHAHARYIEKNPKVMANILAGEHDSLLTDRQYGPAIRHIKRKYGKALAKAAEDAAELERLLRQNDQISARIRTAFVDSVRRIQARIDINELARLIGEGRTSEALQALDRQSIVQGYGPLLDEITAAAIGVARDSARLNTTAGFEASFSQTNPQAVNFLRNYEMTLIRELTADVRASIGTIITEGVIAGRNPIDIARDVRGMIGLTARQSRAVSNYRRLLESGHRDALARQLRDRRFDPSVARAVRGERVLSPEQVNRFVDRYAARYLKHRSETIARTEAKRALGSGNQLLWQQAIDAGRVDADQVTKKWATVGDHKVRDAHRELNGRSIGINERFETSVGSIAYPGDPSASAELTINCRCTAIYRFKLKEGK